MYSSVINNEEKENSALQTQATMPVIATWDDYKLRLASGRTSGH